MSLGRPGPVASPARLWARSLTFRVVATSVVATVVVLAVTGWLLLEQSTRGILEAKSTESVAEASAVMLGMQQELRTTDLRSANVNELLVGLARQASDRGTLGGQFSLVLQGPVSDIASSGLDVRSVPAALRESVRRGSPDGMFTSPTEIRYTDGRTPEPGLVVAGSVGSEATGFYPVYFLFTMHQEQSSLQLVQQAALVTAAVLMPLVAFIVFAISQQILRLVRKARRAAERLAAGHLDERMNVEGPEDTAGLARSMNHMADELAKKIAELEELSVVQHRFVSDVSHELRTPLTTVRMAADVIYEERDEFSPMAARSAELLSRELDSFETLLTDLLEISRFDAGAAVLALEETDLVELVRGEVAAQQPLASAYSSDLVVDAPTECIACVDSRRVRRIVANLLSNAIEHGEGREITIHVRGDEQAAAVAVRDHGIGFESADADKVFARFWRADPSRYRAVGGTGLGLSIALENAQLHSGWLDAWGEPGGGAQFRLTLPCDPHTELTRSPWPLVPPDRTPAALGTS